MSRRRYISTNISTDPKLAALSSYGTFPMLLYTWAIPHLDDWGRMTGEPLEFKLIVCPALDVTVDEVSEALKQIEFVGLWRLYTVDGKQYITVPPDKWFKHQSYIAKGKRDDDSGSQIPTPPPISEEQRETPKNTASFSLSLSPSLKDINTTKPKIELAYNTTELEEHFINLPLREQLNICVETMHQIAPSAYKKYKAGASIKARSVFGEVNIPLHDILLTMVYEDWDAEPAPWDIVNRARSPSNMALVNASLDRQETERGIACV